MCVYVCMYICMYTYVCRLLCMYMCFCRLYNYVGRKRYCLAGWADGWGGVYTSLRSAVEASAGLVHALYL